MEKIQRNWNKDQWRMFQFIFQRSHLKVAYVVSFENGWRDKYSFLKVEKTDLILQAFEIKGKSEKVRAGLIQLTSYKMST